MQIDVELASAYLKGAPGVLLLLTHAPLVFPPGAPLPQVNSKLTMRIILHSVLHTFLFFGALHASSSSCLPEHRSLWTRPLLSVSEPVLVSARALGSCEPTSNPWSSS
ncbi:uncharacterized protein K444DRAFT_418455 [Hyaloscypha bicolor E]|uniref:Uncharacterized protein n=1 Tax=Hyaloscypha bicolor E TaxID=1095630 RepID=A0A2J6T7C6_9HELO|nr:uncharacterized protein K444DRAFT_418455 [Hyaloscypha bicolor E]PMD58908.1 hypothetical protein K444DRAFT_418455 [Hyaloscypha bicolor E]